MLAAAEQSNLPERAWIEQQFQSLAGVELSSGMQPSQSGLAAHGSGGSPFLLQLVERGLVHRAPRTGLRNVLNCIHVNRNN